ncbi:hypothetical protein JCM10296v2_005624 [Rhodotorula toruloides]
MSATDDSAQASPRPFVWDRLPEELQLEVLSNLDYCQLMRVAAVSKKLRGFTQSKRFDSIMFRESPRDGLLREDRRIELHPFLQDVDFFGSDAECATYSGWRDDYKVFKYDAVNQYATSPACTRLSFDFETGDYFYQAVDDPGILTVPSGITAKDALIFLITFWRCQVKAGWG